VKRAERRRFLKYGALAWPPAACPGAPGAFWPGGGQKAETSGPEDIRGTIFKNDAPQSLWKWSKEGFAYERLPDKKVGVRRLPEPLPAGPGRPQRMPLPGQHRGTLYSLAYGNPAPWARGPDRARSRSSTSAPDERRSRFATNRLQLPLPELPELGDFPGQAARSPSLELFPPGRRERGAQERFRLGRLQLFGGDHVFRIHDRTPPGWRAAPGCPTSGSRNGRTSTRRAAARLCKVLGAANVNLKSFSDGDLPQAQRRTPAAGAQHFHDPENEQGHPLEMTNLVVPGYVDDPEMVKRMCGLDRSRRSTGPPLHFCASSPVQADRLAPHAAVDRRDFRKIAMAEGIRYVYIGTSRTTRGRTPGATGARSCWSSGRGYAIPPSRSRTEPAASAARAFPACGPDLRLAQISDRPCSAPVTAGRRGIPGSDQDALLRGATAP